MQIVWCHLPIGGDGIDSYRSDFVDNRRRCHRVNKPSLSGVCREEENSRNDPVGPPLSPSPLLSSFRIERRFFEGQFHLRSANWYWHSRIDSNDPLMICDTIAGSRLQMYTCFERSRFTLLHIRLGSTISSRL